MGVLRVSAPEACLRIALAFAFLYPAIDAFIDPTSWLGYFPAFATAAFHTISIPLKWSDLVLLHAFGLLEIALALWVLIGRRAKLPAALMAFILLIIVALNLNASDFSVLFRDVSIAFAALALALFPPSPSRVVS
jgi:uncharacterized membrane protein YphA (DoxX/SURF4 family)